MRRVALACFGIISLLVAGCAAKRDERSPPASPAAPAAPAAAAPPSGAAQDTTTSTGSGGGGGAPPTSAAPPPAPPTSPTTSPVAKPSVAGSGSVAQAQVSFDQSNQSFVASGTDCISMCKALTSMTNATEHLCELTKAGGENDQKRCTDARAKLAGAQAKVKASCGGCGT